MSRCVVCDAVTSGSLEFCRRHFNEFKEDIKDKKPWVRAMKNEAQRERRRNNREFDNTSLDELMDTEYTRTRY